MNTALVITFDEHGGTYDHVPPPNATPPDRSGAGEMGFTFDRLGMRVPAIVVSAYTAKNTVIHDEMHHGSVINTLCRQHGLEPLTMRDQSANPIFNAVNLTTPRQPYTWPQPAALYVPANPEEKDAAAAAKKHKARPLTAPARGLMGLLLARFNPGAKAPQTWSFVLNQGFITLIVALGGWLIVRERHPWCFVVMVLAIVPPIVSRALVNASVTSGAYTLVTEAMVVLFGVGGAWLAVLIDRKVRGRNVATPRR